MDFYYLLFMLPAFLFSLVCQISVKTTFAKYSKIKNSRGITGADAANIVCRTENEEGNRAYGVTITQTAGSLTDHYDPRTNRIALSQPVYSNTSVAAIGVAAHEAGHALQYSGNYAFIKLRMAIIPVCNIGSAAAPYLILAGYLLDSVSLYLAGILCFCAVALFQLITLPVEFNASRRAIRVLDQNCILTTDELVGAKRVLTAAAMTYVAALATSFMQILFFVTRLKRRN